MPEIGQTISHYRSIEKLGQGGMGVVYRADDTNLNRQVAIKVLPEMFSGDPERMARFEREAKLLASLNHPNIATIHGLEQADGKRFLVMELVEGETQAQRIARGPLSVDESLEVCRQIADGLEAAHEKGIIHRDLKPANVMITPEGKVKILDFGLAKALQSDSPTTDASESPTITDQMTQAGVIIGTAAYMAPEQARGRAVDKRADIWAFGCILYECLTGKRPFHGDTVTETLASILKGDPDWDELPSAIPENLEELLQRCFRKDPRERLRDIGEARIQIEGIDSFHSEIKRTVPRKLSLLWVSACSVALLLAGILVGRILAGIFQPAPSLAVVTSIVKVERGYWLDGMRRTVDMERPTRTAIAISSDGKFIVYSAIEEHPGPQAMPRLFLRILDKSRAKPIAGTEGAINPFLSPDNRWVGFWADRKLKKVPIEGGVPTPLCDAASIYGANWGDNNKIVFVGGNSTGLSIVSSEGGKTSSLTRPDPTREEISHRLPIWLPDGRAVLFTVMRHLLDSQPSIALLRMDTGEWHTLFPDAADARYDSLGHLVFLRQGTLMAVQFDLSQLKTIGQPVALIDNMMQALFVPNTDYHTGAGQFAISKTGSIVYAEGGTLPTLKNTLVWVDQKGIEQQVTALQFPFFAPRLSPDGLRIAYVTQGQEGQVWIYDLNTGANNRLTGTGRAIRPVWAPDSKRLLFGWNDSLMSNLYLQPYDGSSPMERLTTSAGGQWSGSWNVPHNTVAFVEPHQGTARDILLLDISTKHVTPFLNSTFDEQYPEFSVDGRWIAYTSDESTRNEVYVQNYPGKDIKRRISIEGGEEPLWARNGKQLYYRWQDQQWAVDVTMNGDFAAGKPRLLFEKPGYYNIDPIRCYDLSLDGQRFLMVKYDQRKPTPVTEMTLILNWFEELKRLIPTGSK